MSTPEAISEWLNLSLDKITNNKFKDCVKVEVIEVKPLSDQPISVVSDIFRVRVKLVNKNGKNTEIKGVFKMEPTKPGFDDFAKQSGLCNAETLVYSKILKLMEELISSKDKTNKIIWPECYYCADNKFYLQDLCDEGYKIVTTQKMLDVNHAKLTLKFIGQYHAMSLALKDKGMLDISILPENVLTKKIPFLNNIYSGNVLQLANTIDECWDEEWKHIAEKLRKSVENIGDKLKNMIISTQGKCSVLLHGDFTLRNILFKYNDECQGTPTDVKLIDFQGASWANFGLDVVTLLYSSVKPKIREEHLDEFLKVYWESLSFSCSHFGYKGPEITLNDVRKCHDDFNFWGLIMSLFIIPAFLGSYGDFVSEAVEEANGSLDEAASKMINPSLYKIKEVEENLKFQLKVSLKSKAF